MAETVKFPPNLTMGKLETMIENHEQFWGCLTALEAVGGFTLATFEEPWPDVNSLMLVLAIGDVPPPIQKETATHLFNGEAMILGQRMKVAAYRATSPA